MKIQLRAGLFALFLMCCFIAGCSADHPSPTVAGSQASPKRFAQASAKTGDKPAVPAAANENIAPAKNIFQPSAIDPALVRQSMQARSEYEEMNRKIITRTNRLYEENPEIKDLQAKMRDLQKKIDALLAEDEELAKLKKNFQSIAPAIPTMPRKPAAPVSAGGKK